MSDRVRALSRETRKLPPVERAALIDDLLASLDEPDARIDAPWPPKRRTPRRHTARGDGGRRPRQRSR
ncbi:MAG: addiction module protein [Hyphomicrobiales bacterium]|nr:addiction module protein [Hyphomicrobiales bacterium]